MRFLRAALHDKQIATIFVDDNGGTTAEKGVPCPFLTTLNGLKKIGRGAMIDFGKGRNGSLIVRENLSIERNEIALSGILPKLVEAERVLRRRHVVVLLFLAHDELLSYFDNVVRQFVQLSDFIDGEAILPTDPIERFARLHHMNGGRSHASRQRFCRLGDGRNLRSDPEGRRTEIHRIGVPVHPAVPCASV